MKTTLDFMNWQKVFPNGVPRNWRSLLKEQGVVLENSFSRQDLWDLMNPHLLKCELCNAEKPRLKTKIGRLETCGSSECRITLKNKRTAETCLANYGVHHPMKTDVVKAKQKNTFNKIYGKHPTKNKCVQEKRAKTNLEKYGVKTPAIEQSRINHSVKKRKQTTFRHYTEHIWPKRVQRFKDDLQIETHSEFMGSNYPVIFSHSCGTTWNGYFKPVPVCPNCSASQEELSLRSYLDELGVNYIKNDRAVISPYEIDIFIPELKIGIEMNGAYWHREGGAGLSLQKKSELAKDKGIGLIHIFDFEWNEKRDVVKSRIRYVLQLTQNKIMARKCEVKVILKLDCLNFLSITDSQESTDADIFIGLFHNNMLVSVLALQKNTNTNFQIIRFSSELNTVIVDGFSKMLNYVIREFKITELIAHSDSRFYTGSVYEKAGFTCVEICEPSYFWLNGRKRKASTFIPNEQDKHWSRVFDTGSKKWVLIC